MPDKVKKTEKISQTVHTVTDPITTPIKKVQKSFLRHLPKFILYPIELLILFLIILFFFVQTHTFNNWALNIALGKINDAWKEKECFVYAETLRGNVFTGLRLIKGGIVVKSDTLINFDTLGFRYDIFALFSNKIYIRRVNIQNPIINISKVQDRDNNQVWNFAYLFAGEKKEEDTTKKPFEWGIEVENFHLQNGRIRMLDTNLYGKSLGNISIKNSKEFDINNLRISELNLDLEARYYPDFKSVIIKNLSFNTNSDFSLKKLTLDAIVSPKDSLSEIKNLELLTPRTDIIAPIILLNHFDPFVGVNYFDFKNYDVKLDLSAKKFNVSDLIYFLPNLNFMNGTSSLELNADGKYGDLNIKKLILNTGESVINLKGNVKNLNDPSNLYLDIAAKDVALNPRDSKYILPGIPIPDYSYVGKVFGNFTFIGEPLNFTTDFDVRTSSGNANGNLSLNLKSPEYTYKSSFQTSNLNLGGILNNKELESSLNLKADITGRNFELNKISTKLNYEITNSKFENFSINKSAGVVELDNKNISADLSLMTDELETSLKGKINIDKPEDAEYSLNGKAHNLDLAKFTKRSSDRSNLNFSFNINGKGTNPKNIEGNYYLNVQNSFYSSYIIPETPVDIKISKAGSNTELKAITNYFDLKAKGNFEISDLSDATKYHVDLLLNEIQRRFTNDTSAERSTLLSQEKNFHDLYFEYEFITKDIKPLAALFDTTGIKFEGAIKGKMINSSSGYSSETELNIKNFNFQDSVFYLKNLNGTIEFGDDYNRSASEIYDALYPIKAKIDLKGDKVRYSTSTFDSLSIKLNLDESKQIFKIRGGMDSTFILDFAGTGSTINELYNVSFDTLFIRYNNLLISNEGKLVLDYNPDPSQKTISFRQFSINNNLVRFNVIGDLSLAGKSNFDIDARVNRVASLMDLLFPPDTTHDRYAKSKYKSPIKGSIRRLAIHYEGSKEDPILGIEMNSGLLRYENIRLGRIDAFIDYANSNLTTDLLISNAEGNGKMRLNGDIPFVNPLLKGEERTSTSISDYPVNFKLNADNFQLSFFSKLIPNLADIRGLLNGQITATGTVSEPKLTGGMDITKGRFLFGVTGLYHRFTTKLRTENSDLVVDNFRVYNLEDNSRHLDFWGRINFAGLNINNIDLSSSGDLVVLDETARDNDFGMTGNMIIGVGNPPIRIHGDLQKLNLDGQLLIKDANLKFASVPTNPYDITADNFVYKLLKDSANDTFKDTVIVISPDRFLQLDPFLREYAVFSSEPMKKTETNVVYDLNIKTIKNAVISINFNALTSEELFGEMQANLNMTNLNGGNMQIYGNVDIVGDSYYRFYRNFKVKDSRLTFLGQPDNPHLNIQAVYESKTSSSGNLIATENTGTKIILEITGTKLKPELTLKFVENGVENTGTDAQKDAISYLIFGVTKNQQSLAQQSLMAGVTTGSNIVSGMLNNALRDVAPFILNTELNYSGENIATGTDLRVTSSFGDAVVKVGGKIFSGIENTEFNIEYPLNSLLNMNISNNLVLEFSRRIDETGLNGSKSIYTGVKLSYKIRY